MSENEKILKELQEIAPTLSKLYPAEEKVAAPVDYYETLRGELKATLEEQQPRHKYRRLMVVASSIAACLLVVSVMMKWLVPSDDQVVATDYLAAISPEEATHYILDNIDDYTAQNLLGDDEISVEDMLSESLEDIPEDELEDLLDELETEDFNILEL